MSIGRLRGSTLEHRSVGAASAISPGQMGANGSARAIDLCFFRHYLFVALAVVLVSLIHVACEPDAEEQGPELAVRQFVERMQAVHGNPADARAAFDLLWSGAKKNLSERAKRASAVTGKQVAPEEMLVPSRFSLSFRPTVYQTLRVDGDWAEVAVSGDTSSVETYRVRCRREDRAWRVVLELPQLAPIQKRSEGESSEASP